jgi:type VI secretion system secreted protein Hcp
MAVDMFFKIAGVKGESKDSKHGEEIDVLAWSWGMSNAANAHSGGGSGSGKVSVQDLSFTKYVDKASTVLIMACANGTHLDEANLTVRKAGSDPLEYMKIKLHQVFVTGFATGGSGGEDRLTENVTLSFSKFEVAYQPQNSKGGKDGGELFAKYNISAVKGY